MPALVGTDAAREDFLQTFESTDAEQSNPVSEVQVAGDWAFSKGRTSPKRAAPWKSGIGKWVSIYRKTPDGWKYVVDIWNRDPPSGMPRLRRNERPLSSATRRFRTKSGPCSGRGGAGLVAGDVDTLVALYPTTLAG